MKHLETLCVVLMGLWLPSVAVADQDRLGLSDIFELESVSDPRISPDGERIVYVRAGSDVMSDQRYSNLWIIDFDGDNHQPLTTGHHQRSSPRWSPSGDRLAYVSTEEGSSQIHVRFMDTGQTTALTNLQQVPGGLAWSPDGRWIAFSAVVPEAPLEIATVPSPPPGAQWAEPAKVIDRLF